MIFVFLFFATFTAKAQLIDLTIPQESPQSQTQFDESYSNLPNFAVYQKAPELADLFSSKGSSELCFPSAFAQGLLSLYAYQSQTNLMIPGVSSAGEIDASTLVRALAARCKTDRDHGTNDANELACVMSELHDSGYINSDVTTIRRNFTGNPTGLPVQARAPNIEDIRHYVGSGYTVVMSIGWYEYDETAKIWKRTGGHAISVVGYGYNQSWQNNQITLQVINPNLSYSTDQKTALGDAVTMQLASAAPLTGEYTIIGSAFHTNFVDGITAYLPK